MPANKLLIIDDDRELCALLQLNAAAEGLAADCCATGAEGLDRLAAGSYQLVVLDVMLPGLDGFETLARIRQISRVPVLMLTGRGDSASKVRGLRAGADDYLSKPFDMEEFLARVQSLIRRYTQLNAEYGAASPLHYDGLTIDPDQCTVTSPNGTFPLPPKELHTLLYLARHQGKVLTKRQLYEAVWGEPYVYDASNIMAIISRLRKKLEPDPAAPRYIQTVKGLGYRFNREV